MFLSRLLPAACLLFLCLTAKAEAPKGLAAVRLSAPPAAWFDTAGPLWSSSTEASGFLYIQNGLPPPSPTAAHIAYDDKYIYVAFNCFDDQPKDIAARHTTDNTGLDGDDTVTFSIDTFHPFSDNGVSQFLVNPAGIKDASLAGGRSSKVEWQGEWQAKARLVPTGWQAEMRIPWRMLNYPSPGGPLVMGINFARHQARTQVDSQWANQGIQNFISRIGRWRDVVPPPGTFRPTLSLLPHFVATLGGSGARPFGLDGKYTLSPLATLVFTALPDYSQIAQPVVGIGFQHGPRFIPDVRPFFSEGSNIYQAGLPYVVGSLWDPAQIPQFDAGANFYGNLSPKTQVGLLATGAFNGRTDFNFNLHQTLSAYSSIQTALIGSRQEVGGNNEDFYLSQTARHGLFTENAQVALSHDTLTGIGQTADLGLSYAANNFDVNVTPYLVSSNFSARDGFLPFPDQVGVSIFNEFYHDDSKKYWRHFYSNVSYQYADHTGGSLYQRNLGFYAEAATKHNIKFNISWNNNLFLNQFDSTTGAGITFGDSNPDNQLNLNFTTGEQGSAPSTYWEADYSRRLSKRLYLGLQSSVLNRLGITEQNVVNLTYQFSPAVGLTTRVVQQHGPPSFFLSFSRSNYAGIEYYFIVGNPDPSSRRVLVGFKLVLPFEV